MVEMSLKNLKHATVISGGLDALKIKAFDKLTAKKKGSSWLDYPTVEITTKCNLDCKFCSRSLQMQTRLRSVKDISRKDFRFILERLCFFRDTPNILNGFNPLKSTVYFSPCGMGETLLHPDIKNLIKDMREFFPSGFIDITTNGWYLDPWLIDSDVDTLHISLNHVDPVKYKEFHGRNMKDLFDRVIEFLSERGDCKPRVNIQLLDTAGIRESLSFYSRLSKVLRPDDILRRVSDGFTWGQECFKSGYRCGSIAICVDIDGNVFPCCIGRNLSPSVSKLYPDPHIFLGHVSDSAEQIDARLKMVINSQLSGANDFCGYCPAYVRELGK